MNTFALIMVIFVQDLYTESTSMEIPLQDMEGVYHVICNVRRTSVTVVFPELLSKTSWEKMESCFRMPERWACRNLDAGHDDGIRRQKHQLKQRSCRYVRG